MNRLHRKVATAVASSAILLNSALSVFAGTTIVISGNGADTKNDADIKVTTTTNVVQTNTANVSNNVNAGADTGNNDANKNTNGSVSIETGDASTGVGISNSVNSNVAEVDGCCAADVDVLISGNGADSRNKAKLNLDTETNVFQTNYAKLNNNVSAYSDSGGNDANKNTGSDVSIETGDATTTVLVSNSGNANSARVGGGSGNGTISLRILENGADSKNDIDLKLDRSLNLIQDNYASLRNKVRADADTGNNDANKNTGGDVSIETGDAEVGVGIDNMVNFNWADVDCGCLLDVMAKIAGNGFDSDNKIKARLDDDKLIVQENEWVCGHKGFGGFGQVGESGFGFPWWKFKKANCNDVDAYADSGGNDANKNTGGVLGGDPSIETGDAETLVEIENSGNVNQVGSSGPDWELDLPGGFSFNLNLSFSLSDLLAALGLV